MVKDLRFLRGYKVGGIPMVLLGSVWGLLIGFKEGWLC